MKTNIFLIATLIILLVSCDTRPKLVEKIEQNLEIHLMEWPIISLGRLADPAFTDSTDLKSVMNFKSIDLNGNVKSIDMDTAIKLFISNTKKDQPETYPFFEIKNSSKVILPVFGNGLWGEIWGNVVVDKASMKVLNIEFDHENEAPGMGGNMHDSTFKEQFLGSKINFTNQNYALFQSDQKMIEGNHRIDGLSGATKTSAGIIEMLNSDLTKYKKYFR